ncbi:TonB C-terminal domain-containing protein [Bradyrhizobium sp. WSM 1738]|uniref:TonB C-terminal domain-containing protein n=1 Tax=Bradyrhizobium hereditatis TaxID=2821405 RepID=UPI001CE2E694|nr:TonB C-terminal domain-containing protein [Bradyrhizobium hereditatis]MCA6116439.1 TonB C-terminal domain-containing protein [Bradyrhizobium hereditatis]
MSVPVNDQVSAPPDANGHGSTAYRPVGKNTALFRYGATLLAIVAFVGVAVFFLRGHDDMPPPRLVRELTVVNIVPPPPPPPPPPQQMPEQKMIEQPKMAEPEFKEEKPLDKPKDEPVKDAKNDEPPGPLSLDAKATGPGDLFNLGSKVGGNPYGGGGGGGSRWGWYASIVQAQIEAALRANAKTRNATMQVQIRLWADGLGRVNRIQLVSSTGDAELDAAIRNEVLGSIVLREPPPRDMPMPMVTRVTARRPS